MKKTETIAEYLARGGIIKRLPEVAREPQINVIKRSTADGVVTLLSLEEAEVLYGEPNKRTKKAKTITQIDIDALPLELKNKYLAKVKETDGDEVKKDTEEKDTEG